MSFKCANRDLCLQILKGVFRQKRKRQDRKSVSVRWRLIIRKINEWKDNVLIRKQSFLVLLASVFVCQAQLLLNIIKMVQKIAYFLWVFLLLNKSVLKKKKRKICFHTYCLELFACLHFWRNSCKCRSETT